MPLHQLLRQQVVPEPGGGLRDALPLHKGEILREARLGKGNEPPLLPQHRPLGATQRQQLISLPQAVAAEAAQGSPLAVLRPCGRRHLLRQSRPLKKVHPTVESQPEGATLRHGCAAYADALGVLCGNGLKHGEGRQR